MRIELKGLFSPEINEPSLPLDPECCAVLMCVDIGEAGTPAADQFNFTVITPQFLVAHPEIRWGHGYLLMPAFSWREVHRMVERLVSGIRANSWQHAVEQLGAFLEWEFANYQPHSA